MNKTKITILLILFAISVSAQKKIREDNIYFAPKKSVFDKRAAEISNQKTDMEWLRSNLNKYHNQRKKSFIMQLSGIGLTGAALLIKEEEPQKIMMGVGSVLSLSGIVTLISAENHLKRASLPPPE